MANFKMDVDFIDETKMLNKAINKAMKDAMTDITLDIKRVASESAPHKSGFLEKNAEHDVFLGENYFEGTVSFSAVERGFNYAQWTHDKKYKLGKKSAKKKGGRSRFGTQAVPVGTGYLTNAIEFNEKGYLDYIAEKYKGAIN